MDTLSFIVLYKSTNRNLLLLIKFQTGYITAFVMLWTWKFLWH